MRTLTLPIVPLFFLACGREPVAPDISPTFDIGNAPTQSGIVARAGWPTFIVWRVPAAGLAVTLGVDAAEWCSSPGTADATIVTYADKELIDRIVSVGHDTDIPTQVWEHWSGETWGAICARILTGTLPLATGVSHYVSTANDLFGTGVGSDVAMATLHGLLTRPSGGQAVFHFRMQWRQGVLVQLEASLR